MQALQMEPALIEAQIAGLRAYEAALPPENQFLQGFPTRFFKPDARDYFAPLLHYAHYREIAEALPSVRAGDEPFEHHELWEAFRWQPEAPDQLEWHIRRQELSAVSQGLSVRLKKNVEGIFVSGPESELARREESFARQLEQDRWNVTLYENLEHFQKLASVLPEVSAQLAVLISRHPDAHTKMLLVEYFYLRGNLTVFDAFLMYFYIGHVSKNQPADAAGADKKLVELLAGPIIFSGQVLPARVGDALVSLIKAFWAGERPADQIGLDAPAAVKPTESIEYDDFVAHFLRYLGYERELLGTEKFDERYPLEGFYDWSEG